MANSFPLTPPSSDPRFWLETLYRNYEQESEFRTAHRVFTYSSGEEIWLEPDQIWVVCSGVVQISTLHPSGDEVLLGLVVPSMPFGTSLTHLQSYISRALTPVEILCFSLKDIEQSPNLTLALFRQLSRRLRQTESLLAVSSHRRIEERLRQLLLLLAQEVGEPCDQGTRITIKLTHQQLASAIGTSRVTITRLLGTLRQENFAYQDQDRHLIIHHRSLPQKPLPRPDTTLQRLHPGQQQGRIRGF
jgi:CRP-like cAMP-binding protein